MYMHVYACICAHVFNRTMANSGILSPAPPLCSVGNTALTYACCGGYEDVVRILLDAGADVEHQNDNGHTPLMEAASCGHVGTCTCACTRVCTCMGGRGDFHIR